MKHIRTIPVGGIHTSITWTKAEMPKEARDDYGHTDAGHYRINLNDELIADAFNPDATEERTLFHESLHCAFNYTGYGEILADKLGSKFEEALVLALEHAMYPAICEMVAAGAFRQRGARGGSKR